MAQPASLHRELGVIVPPAAPPCRESVAGELGAVVSSDAEKQHMLEILKRLHEQQLEDEEEGGSGSDSGSGSDDGDVVPGLSLARALALAEVCPTELSELPPDIAHALFRC